MQKSKYARRLYDKCQEAVSSVYYRCAQGKLRLRIRKAGGSDSLSTSLKDERIWCRWCDYMCLVAQSCPTFWQHHWLSARILCPWGFSMQEYWSGLPCPPPGNLSNPGIKLVSPSELWWVLYSWKLQSHLPTLTTPHTRAPGSYQTWPQPSHLQIRETEFSC